MSEHDARLVDRVRTRGVLGPDDAARLLLPVADALAALHAAGSAHGALSPAALRIDAEGRARLVDRAEVAPDPSYTAPDPSAGLRAHRAAADVWAFADLLLFVTSGTSPQAGHVPASGTNGFRDIGWLAPITELALVVDPRERPSMAEVAAYLRARVGSPAPRGGRRRPSGAVLAVGGAALTVALALVGAALLFVGGDEDPDQGPTVASTGPAPSGGTGDDDGSAGPSPSESADAVTAEVLEDFARDYIALASSDPDRGFQLLTPSYQRQSPRYREVWAAIDDPRILAITPDPLAMSVSYTYRYSLPGGRTRTEDITLRLVQRGDRLLIAGASAR
ncbi:MAG TPA: hypothetical protein VM575_20310 [Nocardioides sp.]|nr:hypothetical protein [Nocardioides sp.]